LERIKVKVLLVENNPGDVQFISEMLANINLTGQSIRTFELSTVDSLSGSIELLTKEKIDVVLLDLFLSDSHGLETFKRFYTQISWIPVIVLSSFYDETAADRIVRDGAQDFLVKNDLTPNLLVRSIRYAIERKHIQDEKDKIQTQLLQAQKMEAIGILTGGIAHDFNNLITAVRGCADMALQNLDQSDSLYREIKEIQLASQKAAGLTRQMLIFSRKHPVKFEFINLNQLVEDMLKMLHHMIGEDIEIHTDLEPDLWTITADQSTIEQIIMNLTVNARDAMPDGGKLIIRTDNMELNEDLCRSIPESKPGIYVRLTMTDTGIGMDEKTMQRIYEPFFSTKGRGKGTGLGLSVVYGIVKEHKGWISIDSQPGQGTTFKIFTPAIHVKSSFRREEVKRSLEVFEGHGEKILLVEDEESVRRFAERALERNGYEVFAASSASEALDVFKQKKGKIHLVISDVILPDVNGLDLVHQLVTKNPQLNILLSSGYTDHRSHQRLIEKEGYLFLKKPYAYLELLEAVKNAVRTEKK
jgi:two-component system cell cycle sensor histidine kinase/response regulator CckA